MLYNFDADSVGSVPAGWVVLRGVATVQADQSVSLPNSLKFVTAYPVYWAEASPSGVSLADGFIQARIRQNQYGDELHLLFRVTSLFSGYSVRHRAGLYTQIIRLSDWAVIASSSSIVPTGTWGLLRAEFKGSQCRVLLNGVEVIPWSDLAYDRLGNYLGPAYIGEGTVSVWADFTSGASAAWIDDYEVVPEGPPVYYSVTINSAVGGSTIPAAGVYSVEEGVLSIRATPSSGYNFTSYLVDGETRYENPLPLMVDRDITVTPVFTEILPEDELVETYKGREIWFSPVNNYYYVRGYAQTFTTVEDARIFIDTLPPVSPPFPVWAALTMIGGAAIVVFLKTK